TTLANHGNHSHDSSYISNLSTSPDTLSTTGTIITLNLSSASSACSNSSITSIIGKSLLTSQHSADNSPELATYVLNGSVDTASTASSPQDDSDSLLVSGGFSPDANGHW